MASTTAIPAATPEAVAATSAIAAVASAWPAAPVTQIHLRSRWRSTHGARAACGSIEPDSRIGTSRAISEDGAPRETSSQARTVLALTTWSPMLSKPFATICRSPLPATLARACSGTRPPTESDRTSSR
jgi:hypothetical protein